LDNAYSIKNAMNEQEYNGGVDESNKT